MNNILDAFDVNILEADFEYLYSHPEEGFELNATTDYVTGRLKEIGLNVQPCGRSGLVALLGNPEKGRTILLRADMDAISVEGKGIMHACGHAMHTAMLLGAATLLKSRESDLNCCVKLMFQPAEETLDGCKDMIDSGVLKNPDVDGAFMIHVTSGTDFPTGTFIIASEGEVAPSADFFDINIYGKGSHGAEPYKGRDPITAGAHIVGALNSISSKELSIGEPAVITVGSMHSGDAANAVPSMLKMSGTARAYNSDVQSFVRERIEEITQNICKAYRTEGEVVFTSSCPPLKNDGKLVDYVSECAKKVAGDEKVVVLPKGTRGGGSEDFSYISQLVPTAMVLLSAGSRQEGYEYPLHNPNVTFNKNALPYGSALMASVALNF